MPSVPGKEVGIRSIFNVLGPLTNPPRPGPGRRRLRPGARPSRSPKSSAAWGTRGLRRPRPRAPRRISISGETQVSHLKDGEVTTFRIRPEDAGPQSGRAESDRRRGRHRKTPRSCEAVLKGEAGPPARCRLAQRRAPRWSSQGSPPTSPRRRACRRGHRQRARPTRNWKP